MQRSLRTDLVLLHHIARRLRQLLCSWRQTLMRLVSRIRSRYVARTHAAPTPHRLRLSLFNGSATEDAWNPESPAFIDDWKPESRQIECDLVQVTYGSTVRVLDGSDHHIYFFDADLLVVDGYFYGDFTVVPAAVAP